MALRGKGVISLKKWLPAAVWASVTCALFSWAYFRYHHEPRYFYTRQILGQWLCVSRGTAAVLHLCMACVVVPVSRFLHLAVARAALPQRLPKISALFLVHMRKMHVTFAFTLVVASVVHTISHVVNAFNFSLHYNYEYPEVNWGKAGQGAPSLVFTSAVGLSGIGMMVIITLMAYTSLEKVRNPHYNYFWFSHHLAWPFLALYLIHPLSKVIKEISNIEEHKPCLQYVVRANDSFQQPCEVPPAFKAPESDAWKWLFIPLMLMCFDLILRLSSQFKETTVSSVAALPGLALEIFMHCSSFSCSPGQYVLLQVPSVSALEWHPFTIVKCPSDKDRKFSVIVKARGDWTRKCVKQMVNQFILSDTNNMINKEIRLLISGPFASPMEQVQRGKYSVCIGGGVGITPFMSHLRYLLEADCNQVEQLKFIWVCPDASQILWFAWTLSSLHDKFWENNKPDVFNFSIYVTNPSSCQYLEGVLEAKYPIVAQRVHSGRPKWDALFFDIKCEFSTKDVVNIFGCGSKSMLQQLGYQSKMISTSRNRYVLVREAYS
ncbi:NADPH oxidase 4-like [Cloeon dipterum]|uniref:NADPH oxidase 4-like n=1 Tax=Cloeon dipterum TaxID=197152 RepID=UPI00321F73B6